MRFICLLYHYMFVFYVVSFLMSYLISFICLYSIGCVIQMFVTSLYVCVLCRVIFNELCCIIHMFVRFSLCGTQAMCCMMHTFVKHIAFHSYVMLYHSYVCTPRLCVCVCLCVCECVLISRTDLVGHVRWKCPQHGRMASFC